MSEDAGNAERDFRAAAAQIRSNVGVRRLMFVVANILVPTLLMAATDAMSGTSYPAELAWFPERILGIVGLVTASASVLIALVLVRCQVGMVINGAKMSVVRTGEFKPTPLNPLGVSANFVGLSGVSAGLGLWLAAVSWGVPRWLGVLLGVGLLAFVLGVLVRDHARALKKAANLKGEWSSGPISTALEEQHSSASLDETTSDIAVVVTMAVALFSGAFNAMTNVGGIPSTLVLGVSVSEMQAQAIPALAGFLLFSLFLSCRMVASLRVSLARHAQALAELRREADKPWDFRPSERTYLLYAIVLLLGAVSMMILAWSLAGATVAWIAGGLWALAGASWYPFALARARPARGGA